MSWRMSSPLARAAVRDGLRGLAVRAGRRPAAAAVVALTGVASPVAGVVAGHALAETLGPALADPQVARALVAGFGLTAVAAGVALGLVVAAPVAHGAQVAAAPATAFDRAASLLTLPLGGAAAVGIALGGPTSFPLVAAAPGGARSLLGFAAAVAAALCAGGALAAVLRGSRDRSSRLGPPVVALAAAGGASWPLLLAADAVAGERPVGASVLAAAPVLLCSVWAWGALSSAACDPAVRVRPARRLPRSVGGAAAAGALRLLGRRRDVRVAGVGAGAIGCVGIGLALVGGSPPPSATLLATGGAAVAAAPCALAVGGAVRSAEHVWCLAPGRRVVASAWLAASGVVVLTPALAVDLAAAGLDRSLSGVTVAAALAYGAWGGAVLAGTLVPWRASGAVEQAASLGTCAVLCFGLALVAAFVGPTAARLGVPDVMTAISLLALLTLIALHALRRLLGGAG